MELSQRVRAMTSFIDAADAGSFAAAARLQGSVLQPSAKILPGLSKR